MTINSYRRWPFRAMHALTVEETQRWWQACYVPGTSGLILEGDAYWRILAGGPGSGKTAALVALEKEAELSLVVRYDLKRWPGGAYVRLPGENHLAQIMAAAAVAIRQRLQEQSGSIERLSTVQKEFVRWLLQRFDGPRAYARWRDGLSPEQAALFEGVEYEEIYQTTSEPLDVQGQVEELTGLVRTMGYRQILVTVDLDTFEARHALESVSNLFRWLNLIHDPGFRMVAALPRQVVEQARLRQVAPQRVSLVLFNWELADVREIGRRHLAAAVEQEDVDWEDVIKPAALSEAEQLLLEEFGERAPGAWVALVESILHLALSEESYCTLPLDKSDFPVLARSLYERHMPLQLDLERRGVWRGTRFLEMTEKPFDFLQALERRYGRVVYSDEDLLAIAGSKNNLHALARRTREQIEPYPSEPIYIVNRPADGGYHIEHLHRPLTKNE